MTSAILKALALLALLSSSTLLHAEEAYWATYNQSHGWSLGYTTKETNSEETMRNALLYWNGSLQCASWQYAYNNPNAGNIPGPLVSMETNGTRFAYPLQFNNCTSYGQPRGTVYFRAERAISKVVCHPGYVAVIFPNSAAQCQLPTAASSKATEVPGRPEKSSIPSSLDCDCEGNKGKGLVGDPINLANGNVFAEEFDYAGVGGSRLTFQRIYNSSADAPQPVTTWVRWRHSFSYQVYANPGVWAQVVRPDGRAINFSKNGSNYVGPGYHAGKLVALMSGSTQIGWRYTAPNGDEETYNYSHGNIQSIQWKRGGGLTFTWQDSARLTSVSDGLGRSILLTNTSTYPVRLTKATFPDQTWVEFTYDNFARLTLAAYSNGTSRQYQYPPILLESGAQNPAAYNLLAILDESGKLVSGFTYDSQNRGVSTARAGGAQGVTLSYSAGATTVTNALGLSETHEHSNTTGVPQAHRMTIACGVNCPENGRVVEASYDTGGNQTSYLDKAGVLSCSTYDVARGLPLVQIEGLLGGVDTCGAALSSLPAHARATTYQWHPTLAVPMAIAGPLKTTYFQWDTAGRMTSVSEQATNDGSGAVGLSAQSVGAARTSSFTYDSHGFVMSARTPRTDVNGTSTYAYDGAKNLTSVTDPAGLVTTYGNYDANGRPGLITEPSGLQTSLSYDQRGRVTQVSVGGAITSYGYTPAGLLSTATLPTGISMTFTYDAANRVVAVVDSLGNRSDSTLDAQGNVLQETIKGNSGALALSRQMVYDQLSRATSLTKPQ